MLERSVGDGPDTDHTAVFLLLDVVVVVGRVDRITLARVAESDGEVVVLGPRPSVQPPRTARLVIDVETRGRRNVLREHDVEILLAVTLLARLDVTHADERPLGIVERHAAHVVDIGVVGRGKTEVKELRPPEVVERHRGLPEGALRHVAHPLAVERIVDPEIHEGGVQRSDFHAVVIGVDVPLEVVERPDRIAEKIGFERLADTLFLLGGVLRLFGALLVLGLVGVVAVEVGLLAALLRPQDSPGVQLSQRARGNRRQQPRQQSTNQFSRQPRHTPEAEIRRKDNDLIFSLLFPFHTIRVPHGPISWATRGQLSECVRQAAHRTSDTNT